MVATLTRMLAASYLFTSTVSAFQIVGRHSHENLSSTIRRSQIIITVVLPTSSTRSVPLYSQKTGRTQPPRR